MSAIDSPAGESIETPTVEATNEAGLSPEQMVAAEEAIMDIFPADDDDGTAEKVVDEALTADAAEAAQKTEAVENTEATEGDKPAEVEANKEPAAPAEVWTQEKVVAEQKVLEEANAKLATERAELGTHFGVLQKRLEKFKQTKDAVLADKQQTQMQATRLGNIMERLQRGSGEDVVQALGEATGRNGHELFRQIAMRITGQEASPEITEMRATIQKLEQTIQQGQKNQHDASQRQQSEAHLVNAETQFAGNFTKVASDAEKFPFVAQAMSEGKGESLARAAINEAYEHYERTQEALSPEAIVAGYEKQARGMYEAGVKLQQSQTPSNGAGGEATPTAGQPAANPQAEQSPPGKTLTNELQADTGEARPATDAEVRRQLADDPGFLNSIGIPV